MARVININGRLVSDNRAAVSVFDHGLLYGSACYATMRVCNGHVFLIDDQLQKINDGLNDLCILLSHGIDWEAEIRKAIRANGLNNGLIRITVTGGNVGWVMPRKPYSKPNFFIFTREKALPDRIVPKSIVVLKTPYYRPKVNYKTVNRTYGVKARRELWGKNGYDGLFISDEGAVAEGIDTNIFMVRNGDIVTPHLSTGILPGLTRQYVIQLASSLGFRVHEEIFTLKQLQEADEIFITNTGSGISPVYKIHNVLSRSYFPVAQRLWERYINHLGYLRSAREIGYE